MLFGVSCWCKLFNSVDSKQWTNILGLVELLFCLPMSNGRLELFSQMKIIKSDRCSCLNKYRLDDLLSISVDGPPLSQWDSSGAVDLWWNDKTRRVPNKDSRNYMYEGLSGSQSTDEDLHVGFEDWETWLNTD